MENASDSLVRKTATHIIFHKYPGLIRKMRQNGLPAARISEMSESELRAVGCRSAEFEDIKRSFPECGLRELRLAASQGVTVIADDDSRYPGLLSKIYDPPAIIYVLGKPELLKRESLAVVGSRRASSYGYRVLEDLLPAVCRSGLVIVSGMAYGIDARSHTISLREKGMTVGVNAGGLLHLYPAGNQGLIRAIVEHGAVASEFPLEIIPRPFYFPIRNRVIAGLSRAVLVVEAAPKSGSLITARLALEQNREVMAVPGPITSPLSEGTNMLLQDGAKIVLRPADILEEYGLRAKDDQLVEAALAPREKRVLDLLAENEVKSIDDFVEDLGFSTPETISLLMGLLLKNLVVEEAGFFRRKSNA